VPVETVLQGPPRLHASNKRQRRENIPAWGEAPGKRHKPRPTRAEGPWHWRRVWCTGLSDRGIYRTACTQPFRLGWYVPAPLALRKTKCSRVSPHGWAG